MSPPVQKITSLANPLVKAARALHLRKGREESGEFLAEGLKIVCDGLEQGFAPRRIFHSGPAEATPRLAWAVEAVRRAGGQALEASGEVLEKISRRENPQTVVGVFAQRWAPLESFGRGAAPAYVVLEAVRDPGNLGTIVRTADASGCGGVLLVGECCDPFSVEAVRATMGSIFAVPVARADRASFLAWRAAWPGSVVGTHLSARAAPAEAPYRAPTLIVLGNEQQGLSAEVAAACDLNVKIPMRGRADSLNLAVAAGVMMYAATERLLGR